MDIFKKILESLSKLLAVKKIIKGFEDQPTIPLEVVFL